MIDLHYWTTPNGHKITMFLEETGLPYKIFPVNIGKGDQFKPEFLAIAPNNRIPAMVDHEPKGGGKPISIFESGAMLLYLAEKTGKFLPADLYGRYDAIQWTFWQMGGLGPMAGQNHHFRNYAVEKIKYAIDRYVNETNRLYGVLNKRLSDREFIAGDYSIADMASYPWVVPYKNQGQNIDDFPHLKRWLETIRARPATMRAYAQGEGGQSEFRPAGRSAPRRSARSCSARPRRWCGRRGGSPQTRLVIRGLDPRIHLLEMMDCRVKPGNDGGCGATTCHSNSSNSSAPTHPVRSARSAGGRGWRWRTRGCRRKPSRGASPRRSAIAPHGSEKVPVLIDGEIRGRRFLDDRQLSRRPLSGPAVAVRRRGRPRHGADAELVGRRA